MNALDDQIHKINWINEWIYSKKFIQVKIPTAWPFSGLICNPKRSTALIQKKNHSNPSNRLGEQWYTHVLFVLEMLNGVKNRKIQLNPSDPNYGKQNRTNIFQTSRKLFTKYLKYSNLLSQTDCLAPVWYKYFISETSSHS